MKALSKAALPLLVFVSLCALVSAQSTNSRLDGIVRDSQGAVIVGVQVSIFNVATGQTITAISDARGEWVSSTVPVGAYKVTFQKTGFKTKVVEDVAIYAGTPASINTSLEVGTVSETVEVNAGAEVLQTATAAVTNTITGRQVVELPFASRNTVELLVTQPGTQTPSNPRSSSINGLPKGALNITMDGMNVQDNLLKSSDGFFAYIYPSQDSVEEVTLTTSASGVDSTSQGAAQIKFVTRSGGNAFHGGAFWQVRNTWFDSNYYFNNQGGLARDVIKLNQGGGHVGGPIKKNKAFFFVNYEIYKLPATKAYSRTILTDSARNGIFTYKDTGGTVRTVDLYKLAAAGNAALPASVRPFSTTPDPILASTYAQIASAAANGIVSNNLSSNDYNHNTLSFSPTGLQDRKFFTTRLDYNITTKHVFSLVYNFDKYNSVPDFLNNVVPEYPGSGVVLGTDIATGQISNRFAGSISLRSTFSPQLTNEFRAGLNGGTVLFFPAIGSASIFSPWRGYVPSFGFSLSGVTSTTNSQRRNSPVKEYGDTVSWVKGRHQISIGGNYDQVNLWNQVVGTSVIPGISFGVATGDPIITGNTGIFNSTNFPGSSNTNQSDAAALYAALTGRVSSISRAVGLDETSKTYGYNSLIDRDRIREFGLFFSDTWKMRPDVTINVGLRYERQLPFVNISGTYTQVGLAGLYGVSGVGNLFKPGTLTGTPTVGFLPTTASEGGYTMPAVWAPGFGLAWQLPGKEGVLGWLLGNKAGSSVVRLGYSIATIREGSNVFTSIWGSNQGLSLSTSVSNASTPADFGAAGSVLFRDPALPVKSGVPNAPTFPLPITSTTVSLNDFDPKLKVGYVQSWNIGLQRQFGANALEVRYTGNHGLKEWRQYNLNEINTVENGFISEFNAAAANLALARKTNPNSNTFGGQPGMAPVPILTAALGVAPGAAVTDSTTASNLVFGQVGTLAAAIAQNTTRMANLVKAGYPVNMFLVNPAVAGTSSSNGGSYILTNAGSSYYDALQFEFRRRMTGGLLTQFSYAWSKSLANGATASSVDSSQPTTLRNLNLDKIPSGFDIRHGLKLNAIYELPFGPGRRFLSSVNNPIAKKALEGWEFAGIMRLQSGTPLNISSFATFNQNGSGVVLHNMDAAQLQSMIGNYKTTSPNFDSNLGRYPGIVYFLPLNVINNTKAAFGQGGLTPAQVDPTQPYIGPAPAGQNGWKGYIYLPWQRHYDVSVVKITKITEKTNVELRCQMLNVFNITNFLPNNNIGSSFGQTTTAYQDLSGTVDPGGRIIEFVLRFNF
jgi:hypothetical protein